MPSLPGRPGVDHWHGLRRSHQHPALLIGQHMVPSPRRLPTDNLHPRPHQHRTLPNLPNRPDLSLRLQRLPTHHLHLWPHQHRVLPVGAVVSFGRSPDRVALAPHRQRQPHMPNPHHHQNMRNLVARPRPLIPPTRHLPAVVSFGRSPDRVALAPHRQRQPHMPNPHHHQNMRNLVARPRPLIPPTGYLPANLPGRPNPLQRLRGLPTHHLHPRAHQHRTLPNLPNRPDLSLRLQRLPTHHL